jgi:hypothetical protein
MLETIKVHGEIAALAFGLVKDRACGATASRRPCGPSLSKPKARANLPP